MSAPCICPEKPTQAISSLFSPLSAIALRTATPAARHQSSGCCSAQPIFSEANGSCSSVAEATMRPSARRISARVPPVPMSIPRTWPGIVLTCDSRQLLSDKVGIGGPERFSFALTRTQMGSPLSQKSDRPCQASRQHQNNLQKSLAVYVNGRGIVPRSFWIASIEILNGGSSALFLPILRLRRSGVGVGSGFRLEIPRRASSAKHTGLSRRELAGRTAHRRPLVAHDSRRKSRPARGRVGEQTIFLRPQHDVRRRQGQLPARPRCRPAEKWPRRNFAPQRTS